MFFVCFRFCTNGGTCFEFQYAKCRCMEGYDGPRCENNHMLSECDQFATRNITTNPISNETECICKPNFKGDFKSTAININAVKRLYVKIPLI